MKLQINKGTYWSKHFKQIQILPNLTFAQVNGFCVLFDWLIWFIEFSFTNKIEEDEQSIRTE